MDVTHGLRTELTVVMVFAHITDFKAKRSVSTSEYNDPTAVVPRYLGKMPQTLFPPHTASFVAAAQLHSCMQGQKVRAKQLQNVGKSNLPNSLYWFEIISLKMEACIYLSLLFLPFFWNSLPLTGNFCQSHSK